MSQLTSHEVRASYPQERIWFVHQLAPASGAYNISLTHAVPAGTSLDALRWALAQLIARHEVLRTVFVERDGVVFQVIHAQLDPDLAVVDLVDRDDPDRAQAIERLTAATVRVPFVLDQGPLIRATAIRTAPDRLSLLIVMHHIVSDGWSMGVLASDLDHLCADHAGGVSTLPPLPIQYADFSEWQRSRCGSPKLQAQVGYWLTQLKDAPPVIELPLDRPRTGNPEMAGKVKLFAIPADASAAIGALGRAQQATTFMVIVAALKALLFRMTGQSDIVLATVVANRTRVELESMIGCFLNNLVLRDKLSAEMTFDQLVAAIRDTTLDAYSNQDAPFELVVEQMNLPRSLSHNAVFQVMVAFQNFVGDMLAGAPLGDAVDGRITTAPAVAKFELSLSMWEAGGTLGGGIEYRSDLFDDATIDRLIGHFRTLLADAAARPQAKLRDLAVLSPRDHDLIVRQWNGWALDYPRDGLIHRMIEAQVERTPYAIAVILGDDTLTYRALNARANRLAHRLIAEGCKPETIVGLMLEQSLDMIVGILAVLKAGGAYLPIDPNSPPDRLGYVVGDARPLVVLTHAACSERLVRAGTTPWLIDSVEKPDTDDDAGAANPAVAQNSLALAYVLYTSGSTGRPKGVMVEHRSVLHHLWGMNLQYAFGPADCFFQSHSYAFDVSVWEFFMPLVTGGRVAMVRPDGHKDPAYIVSAMIAAGVTYACLLPPMLHFVLDEPRVGELNATLRWVICGGEPLSPELVTRAFDTLTARLDNAYGPTEATVHNTFYHCIRGPQPAAIPIGRAMPGTAVYILDAHLNPVPIGASGEICIGGDAVARGYLGAPELTAQKFVRDPFSDDLGARLYRTGDVGRFLPDGHIEFQGRRDMQIKLRGFRIELGEITHSLKQHPAVGDAVTILREDRPGDRRIVSYVVTSDGRDPPAALLADLATRLPEHMIPSAIVRLDRLPLKDSNKVDMAALTPPTLVTGTDTYVAPDSDDERRLAAIWIDLLGIQQAGLRDNFFELGGHSLLVTRLISRIRAEMGVTLAIKQVFRAPLLGELAAVIQAARGSDDGDDDIILRRARS